MKTKRIIGIAVVVCVAVLFSYNLGYYHGSSTTGGKQKSARNWDRIGRVQPLQFPKGFEWPLATNIAAPTNMSKGK